MITISRDVVGCCCFVNRTEQTRRSGDEEEREKRYDMTDEDYSLFNYFVETITIGMVITLKVTTKD